jgi:hypothetical protein
MAALLFPSMVRDDILEQHADLRARLDELAEEVGLWRQREPGSGDRLRALGRDLCARFNAHLEYEDEELVPVLSALDSWGPERVRDLRVAHTRQRRKLATLWTRLDYEPDPDELERALADLAEDMSADMESEEEGLLSQPKMSAPLLECA